MSTLSTSTISPDQTVTLDTRTTPPLDWRDNIDLEVGKRLKAYRLQADKTQAEIAEWLDISPQQYQKYEKGASKCNIANLYRLAEYYNRPITDLLPGRTEHEEKAFHEEEKPFTNKDDSSLTDEAEAMAALLAVFVRIPSKTMRKKVLDLLNNMFQ